MENEKKSNGTLVGILIGLVIALIIGGCLLATETISFNKSKSDNNSQTSENAKKETEKRIYTYDEVKGVYTYETETQKDDDGNEYKLYFNLKLFENGTFSYRRSYMAPFGEIGNYIIKDNTIVLNYLFTTNSGVGIHRTTGTKTIVINSDNTLTDSSPNISVNNKQFTSVILKKDLKADMEDEFKHYIDAPISDATSRN